MGNGHGNRSIEDVRFQCSVSRRECHVVAVALIEMGTYCMIHRHAIEKSSGLAVQLCHQVFTYRCEDIQYLCLSMCKHTMGYVTDDSHGISGFEYLLFVLPG